MKVAIDYQTALGQKTGFGYYVKNLVENLEKIDKNSDYLLIKPNTEEDFSTLKRFYWDQVKVPLYAKKNKVELLHQPAFSAPIFYSEKMVVTVCDLISVFFGQDIPFISRQYFGKWMPFTYRKADHIIAISEQTKKDIIKFLAFPEEKITVIYLGADEKYFKQPEKSKIEVVKKKFQTGKNYFIHVGTINPRKNLEFLVKAFSNIVHENNNWNLVIAGKKGWYYDNLFKLVAERGLEKRVIFTGYVDDDEKHQLYWGAGAFVFPSIYEGFGLPPLEAMSAGVPVISSCVSSMPEVVGEVGVLLDPHDEESWSKTMLEFTRLTYLRRKLSALSKERAKLFTWGKTARQTIEVYQKVVNE